MFFEFFAFKYRFMHNLPLQENLQEAKVMARNHRIEEKNINFINSVLSGGVSRATFPPFFLVNL